MKPQDYLEAILYLITTPDAFSEEDADKLIEGATLCLREVFGRGQRSMRLMEAVLNYQEQRHEEVEQIKALQGQAGEEKR